MFELVGLGLLGVGAIGLGIFRHNEDKKAEQRIKAERDSYLHEGKIIEKFYTHFYGWFCFKVLVFSDDFLRSKVFTMVVPASIFDKHSVGDVIGVSNINLYNCSADYSCKG